MPASPDEPDAAPDFLADVPRLPDPWDVRGGIRLDGSLERTSFSTKTVSLFTGLFALGVAFILFQVLVTPIVLISQIGLEGLEALAADPEKLLATYTRELVVSNSAGQIFGLALPALLFARLHTSRPSGFLRVRGVDGVVLGWAVGGLVVLQPVVQWLAELNRMIPVPDHLQALDQSQIELIMQVLSSDLGLVFTVAMLAVVPGICEELLFRGYAQRQFERAFGAGGGILLSGVLFGMYHLRLSQIIPLAVLGVYLAYLTWRTGSLLPAVLVHFLHNGVAVVAGHYAEASPDYSVSALQDLSVPTFLALAALVFFAGIVYVLHHRARALRAAQDDAPPGA